jgi:hypothetical protein
MERCKIINSNGFRDEDIIEIKQEGDCDNCGYSGMVWFIEDDENIGLCDNCLKRAYSNSKIVPLYEGKEYPNCNRILKIIKRGTYFEVLYKPLFDSNGDAYDYQNIVWGQFGYNPEINCNAIFQELKTAKEFIKFLEENNPSNNSIQIWIEGND